MFGANDINIKKTVISCKDMQTHRETREPNVTLNLSYFCKKAVKTKTYDGRLSNASHELLILQYLDTWPPKVNEDA